MAKKRIIPKSLSILILAICLSSLSACGSDEDYKYRYDEISSAVMENESVFNQAVSDMIDIHDKELDRSEINKLDKLYRSKTDKAEISYIADTKREPIEYVDILKDKEVLSEFTDEYGEEVIDVFEEYKNIDGLYACYILDGEDHFVPVKNKSLEEVFKIMPVNMIWYDPDKLNFSCGEKVIKTNYYVWSDLIFTMNGEEPEAPDYFPEAPIKKDKGLIYEDESTFYYIERLTDNFFFTSQSGWDT